MNVDTIAAIVVGPIYLESMKKRDDIMIDIASMAKYSATRAYIIADALVAEKRKRKELSDD